MLVVFGSLVLDRIHAPDGTVWDELGGSSTYAALAASRFTETRLISVAGTDLPESYAKILSGCVDINGLEIVEGRTFRYEARYEDNFDTRVDLVVEPNVSLEYQHRVPEEYRGSDFVYLANMDPVQQISLLGQFEHPKFVMCDTISYWINAKKDSVVDLISMVDAVIINDDEARHLTGSHSLIECAGTISGWGARHVIIKKAEHGSLLFCGEEVYPLPGFPVDGVEDPTGAGDSFAGAVMGYLDSAGSVGTDELRRACMYGNVLGSFAVGRRGLGGLINLTRADIEERVGAYRRMICLNAR